MNCATWSWQAMLLVLTGMGCFGNSAVGGQFAFSAVADGIGYDEDEDGYRVCFPDDTGWVDHPIGLTNNHYEPPYEIYGPKYLETFSFATGRIEAGRLKLGGRAHSRSNYGVALDVRLPGAFSRSLTCYYDTLILRTARSSAELPFDRTSGFGGLGQLNFAYELDGRFVLERPEIGERLIPPGVGVYVAVSDARSTQYPIESYVDSPTSVEIEFHQTLLQRSTTEFLNTSGDEPVSGVREVQSDWQVCFFVAASATMGRAAIDTPLRDPVYTNHGVLLELDRLFFDDGTTPEDLGLEVSFLSGNLVSPNLLPGDANGDRLVDIRDFVSLRKHFGLSGGLKEGDLDYNGKVDLADFIILRNNFGRTAQAVPEARSISMVTLATLLAGWAAWHRRTRGLN